MTTAKRTPLARQTEIVHEGLTVTTWGNEHYGHLRLLGIVGPDDNIVAIDITLSTLKAQGGGDSPVEVVAKALARLKEATS